MGDAVTTDPQSTARARILDAAERAFADDGFAGASMKTIAQRAEVAQGLLHYHFTNKEGLYAAVIARRSGIINAERRNLLDMVDFSAPDVLAQILHALFAPPLGVNGGGRAYARILAGLTAGDTRDAELVRTHYDETAHAFIDALERALPGTDRLSLAWGYSMAITTLVAAVTGSGRPERLANRETEHTDPEGTLARLITYVAGGITALATEQTDIHHET